MKTLKKTAMLCALLAVVMAPLMAGEGMVPPQFDWTWYSKIKSGPKLAFIKSGELEMKALYDEKGRLVEFWSNAQDLSYSERFEYFNDGKLKRHSFGSYEAGVWTLSSETSYVYNSKGQLASKVLPYEPFNVPSVIDNKGNASFVEPGGEAFTLNNVFDTNGRLVEKIYAETLSASKQKVFWKVSYSYDKDGRRSKSTIVIAADIPSNSPALNLTMDYSYRFDADGNLTAITVKKTATSADIYLEDWYMADVSIRYESVPTATTSQSKVISKVGSKAKVLWNGTWYDATVIEQKDQSYKITYEGYDSSWDEWVESDRITF